MLAVRHHGFLIAFLCIDEVAGYAAEAFLLIFARDPSTERVADRGGHVKPALKSRGSLPDTNIIEGINNRIKLIKRRAFGYVNFGHFRQRVLIEFAGLH